MIALAIAAVIGFASPTGNIDCEASSSLLVCHVTHSAYGKQLQAGCRTVDWNGFSLTATGKGQVLCSGGAMFGGAPPRHPTLRYGVRRRHGAFACVVRLSGLTCTNRRGHGMFVSRTSYRLF
ncbi:MAG TPA: DUF6636 domain-containing protein [Gaiellaceae bacterium]|nr:DUF6636 domain-containing protein [Gaiellaceae bacterium]